MPPPESGKRLTPEQIGLLRRWVAGGAPWKEHWAYLVPERPTLPAVEDKRWPRNPIDRFVLARLEAKGLAPAPEADRTTLIRRVSLDLTGLPPTVEEVDAYLADKTPAAYEKVVDRLLASAHFGERMAVNWLDLARYADTSGYHFDGIRFMWLWRDWVIRAFNDDLPFDQFTIDQVAGDLLPHATVAQQIASGFNRNNMTTDEGGADPDEYLTKYAVDRVDTTGTVWLGLTVGCAECHDHKFDLLTQKEFYQFYAFFHSVPEKGLDRIRTDNPPPRLAVPSPEQARLYVERDFALRDAEKTLRDRENELGEAQEKWERLTNGKPPPAPDEAGLLAVASFDGRLEVLRPVAGASPPASVPGAAATVMGRTNRAVFADGRWGKALALDGHTFLEVKPLGAIDRTNRFSLAVWARLESGNGALASQTGPEPGARGWAWSVTDGRLELALVNTTGTNAVRVRTKDALPLKQWLYLLASYDGSGKAAGVRLYVEGEARPVELQEDTLSGSIATTEPIQIGARSTQARLEGRLADFRWYNRVLSAEEARQRALAGYLPIVAKTGGQRTSEQESDLRRFFREHYAIDLIRSQAALARARAAKEELENAIPTTMVMAEMPTPRETHVLIRGDFRQPGERVFPGVPAFLPPLPSGRPPDRLALARWLVATNQPLTARVTVNRYWQLFFGTGIVKTVNDFGSQGEWPSHPELLDWLACQFRDGGPILARVGSGWRRERRQVRPWDTKELIRLMVTSATYRQTAAVSPERRARDPDNRLLSRGPRHRLAAEFVRDNALAISGLLNPRIGGPSVKPYQPPGIWDGTDAQYVQDHGPSLYRRGLYVFWRRSAHYPSFALFDAPNREVCTFLRQETETPLQSLVLMDDPVYVEAARALAQRVLADEPTNLDHRLVRAFRLALARPPAPAELAILRRTYEQQLTRLQADPASASALLAVGESPRPKAAHAAELAALTTVASLVLNLNETISN